jgi:hypothetical protein
MLVGEALKRNVAEDVAVPESDTTGGVFGALLETVSVPVNVFAVVGANLTLRFTDWPAATVFGNVVETRLNPVPVTVAPVTDIEVPPVLETLTVNVEVVPATILPKLSAVGVRVICAGGAVTVTVADADFVLSATLVACTV